MKDATSYWKPSIQLFFKNTAGSIGIEGGLYSIVCTCPNVGHILGGVSVLKNGSQVVVISITTLEGFWIEVFDGHCARAREAHAITMLCC